MADIQNLLQAFFDGHATLTELEQGIESSAADPVAAPQILQALDAAFASGRLPTQVYHMLKSKIDGPAAATSYVPPASPNVDEPTEITIQGVATPAAVDDGGTAATIQPAPDDETLQPAAHGGLADASDATRFVAAIDDRTETDVPDVTRIVSPAFIGRPDSEESTTIEPVSALFEPYSGPTGSNWSRPDQWTDTQAGPIQPGSVIKNRFVIESQLGQGGMGIVFKARDRRKEEARDADPYIAIKILNEEFRNHPQALISLQREATKAQTLAHPNIITVYDFDRDGTTVYMTMELMRGQSLSDYIRSFRRGGAGREDAIPVIMEMAAGLAYAHKRGIVHSDFKPGNVFLTEDNRVKILDFGIARATQYGGVNKAPKDQFDAGELGALTPGYASLEMLNGKPPDPSDDVYALAVTAYQILTGGHPFNRKTAQEARAGKMTPKPIKGLKRREWQTISKGLALTRGERIPDAEHFIRKFRGPTKATKGAAASIVSLALVATYFLWASIQPLQPPFPFEELSADDQRAFEHLINEGEIELTYPPEIRGAFQFFAQAYDIHPRNPRAVAGLDEVAKLILETSERISTRAEKQALLRELDNTFLQNEHLGGHKKLVKLYSKLKAEVRP